MGLIYMPSLQIKQYKIFGVTLNAVELSEADFETGMVVTLQCGWFFDLPSAASYANDLNNGGL